MEMKNLLILFCFGMLFCPSVLNASGEEERMLNSENFIFIDLPGRYKEIKANRRDNFQVWKEVTFTTGNVKALTVDYDQKWTLEDTRAFSEYEVKNKFKGQLDIHEVYWKNNEVQAYTVKSFYPALGTHKVTDIFNRQYLLKSM